MSLEDTLSAKQSHSIPSLVHGTFSKILQALDMENIIRSKMAELPPDEFEGVLHPAFQEDEIQLILLGGVLGAIVGALQLLIFK